MGSGQPASAIDLPCHPVNRIETLIDAALNAP